MKVQLDPKRELEKTLAKASAASKDLRVPLTLIAQQWFKSNRAIFTLKGPGKYIDYRPGKDGRRPSNYEKFKIRHLGSQYPMMRLTGRLAGSITDPTDAESINLILNNKSLVLGTSVPYADAHQNPLGNSRPRRPVVLYGNEQVAPGALSTRIKQWQQILLNYVVTESGAKP